MSVIYVVFYDSCRLKNMRQLLYYSVKYNRRVSMKLRLNIKLILLTLCIAVPVTAVITFMGIRSNDTQRRQILAESQAEVQGTMSQIDAVLELLEHALAFMSVDDTQIRSIALAQERTTGFWLDNHEVMEKLQYQTMISGLNMTPFIYYPRQDIFIIQSRLRLLPR